MVINERFGAASAAAPMPTTAFPSYAEVAAAAPTTPTRTFSTSPPLTTFAEAAAEVSAAMADARLLETIDVSSLMADEGQDKFVGGADLTFTEWDKSLLDAEEISLSMDNEDEEERDCQRHQRTGDYVPRLDPI